MIRAWDVLRSGLTAPEILTFIRKIIIVITGSESPRDHGGVHPTTNDRRLFTLVIGGLPTYKERYHIEAALSICRVCIQDIRYNFRKQTLTYRLTTEQYQLFLERFKQTSYWEVSEIKNVSRP